MQNCEFIFCSFERKKSELWHKLLQLLFYLCIYFIPWQKYAFINNVTDNREKQCWMQITTVCFVWWNICKRYLDHNSSSAVYAFTNCLFIIVHYNMKTFQCLNMKIFSLLLVIKLLYIMTKFSLFRAVFHPSVLFPVI